MPKTAPHITHLARRQGLLSVADIAWCGIEWSGKVKIAHNPRQANCALCLANKAKAVVNPPTTVNGTARYEASLKNMSPSRKKELLSGDWDVGPMEVE